MDTTRNIRVGCLQLTRNCLVTGNCTPRVRKRNMLRKRYNKEQAILQVFKWWDTDKNR